MGLAMTDKMGLSNGNVVPPLAVTVAKACELSGFGPTSIWAFLKSGRLEAVRVPGVRRTLVNYASLARLLSPPEAPQLRKRGRAHHVSLRIFPEFGRIVSAFTVTCDRPYAWLYDAPSWPYVKVSVAR
jgi:hypothetical protein